MRCNQRHGIKYGINQLKLNRSVAARYVKGSG